MKVEDMDVYKRAHIFTLYMYKITSEFPKEERYGLTSQIKRSSASINANLMEGSARKTNGEYRQFIHIARGSAEELRYHLILARDLNFVSDLIANKCLDELNEISKMLNGLLKVIK